MPFQQILPRQPGDDRGKVLEMVMPLAYRLNDPTLFTELCYIGGDWVGAKSSATFPVDNPATGDVIGSVPQCGAQETDDAIAAADRAFQIWRKKTAGERGALLERWFDLMIENGDDLAHIV